MAGPYVLGGTRHEQSSHYRACRLHHNLGGRIRRLEAQKPSASGAPKRRGERPDIRINGSGCHGFGAGPRASHLECQYILHSARGRSDTLSAQILRLDQMLRRYGSETEAARQTLRQYAEQKTADLFPDNQAQVRLGNSVTYELLQRLEDMLLVLKPTNPRDQWWMGQAMTLAGKIGDTRWLIAQHVGQGTPKAFVALLVFWLALLFSSFGLFAPHNATSAVVLTLCAFAVAGAVAMFLELEQGFGRIIHVSPKPMRQAVQLLEAQQGE